MEKFLLDENIPPAIDDFLREKGFDVEDVWGLGNSGVSDEDLIAIASEHFTCWSEPAKNPCRGACGA